jgi:TnpA family transposase
MECKYGFIPGSGETAANRIRRKFRMTKGGNPQLILVHYSRGQAVRKSPSQSKTYFVLSTFWPHNLYLYSVFTKRQP